MASRRSPIFPDVPRREADAGMATGGPRAGRPALDRGRQDVASAGAAGWRRRLPSGRSCGSWVSGRCRSGRRCRRRRAAGAATRRSRSCSPTWSTSPTGRWSVGDEAALDLLRKVGREEEDAICGREGEVVKRMGDGLMAVFPDAAAAVAAAHEACYRVGAIEVRGYRPRMRAGVHVGRPRRLGRRLPRHRREHRGARRGGRGR